MLFLILNKIKKKNKNTYQLLQLLQMIKMFLILNKNKKKYNKNKMLLHKEE